MSEFETIELHDSERQTALEEIQSQLAGMAFDYAIGNPFAASFRPESFQRNRRDRVLDRQ